MRTILVLVILVIGGMAAYEYGYKGEPLPQSVDQAERQAKDAGTAARHAFDEAAVRLGPAVRQAADSVRLGFERLKASVGALAGKAEQGASSAVQTVHDKAAVASGNASQGASPADTVAPAAGGQQVLVDGSDIGIAMREAVGRVRAALVGIADASAARDQLPTLKTVNAELAHLQGKVDTLSPDGKRGFARLVGQDLPALKTITDRVKGLKGLDSEVGGTLDQIVGRVDGWGRAEPA